MRTRSLDVSGGLPEPPPPGRVTGGPTRSGETRTVEFMSTDDCQSGTKSSSRSTRSIERRDDFLVSAVEEIFQLAVPAVALDATYSAPVTIRQVGRGVLPTSLAPRT